MYRELSALVLISTSVCLPPQEARAQDRSAHLDRQRISSFGVGLTADWIDGATISTFSVFWSRPLTLLGREMEVASFGEVDLSPTPDGSILGVGVALEAAPRLTVFLAPALALRPFAVAARLEASFSVTTGVTPVVTIDAAPGSWMQTYGLGIRLPSGASLTPAFYQILEDEVMCTGFGFTLQTTID